MKPLILDHIVTRKTLPEVPYFYNRAADMSYYKTTDGRNIPFIDSCDKSVYLMTKTEAQRERDDSDIVATPLLELCTKTFTEREQDD